MGLGFEAAGPVPPDPWVLGPFPPLWAKRTAGKNMNAKKNARDLMRRGCRKRFNNECFMELMVSQSLFDKDIATSGGTGPQKRYQNSVNDEPAGYDPKDSDSHFGKDIFSLFHLARIPSR